MTEIALVSIIIFGFGLVSERWARTPLTGPMVFTAFGLIIGAEGFDVFDLDLGRGGTEILVEATLVLVLFSDAARIDVMALRRERWMPSRLLGIGLPLTLVLGTLLALALFPDLSLVYAVLIAAVVAPTDAALGQAVVSDRRLPTRVRQGLNVESGLNDGIVLPVVTACVAIAAAEEDAGGVDVWGSFLARQIGFGVLVGLLVGVGGGRLLSFANDRDWVEGIYRQLGTLALAAAAFACASLLDGNGFIAAFVAGLAFGAIDREGWGTVVDFTQDEGELLSAITFVLFGAVLMPLAVQEVSVAVLTYAALSLVLVRMIAVVLSLVGSGTLFETRLFAGWFGPRGLATVLFALVVFEELESGSGETVYVVACWTVLLSVFAHGVTASAWTTRLAGRLASGPADAPEMMPTDEMPTRRP